MSVLDGDSLSLNGSLFSSAYFSLFLLIDMTKGRILFKDFLLHLRADLPVLRQRKKSDLPLPYSTKLHGKEVEMCRFP